MMRFRFATCTASIGLLIYALPVLAQDNPAAPADAPEEIVVTAQKRKENLQNVPLSIQALDTKALEQRGIASFNDYVKFLPSVSYDSLGPGQAEIFFRGISNGNRLSTGSLPTVGVYLDEAPVTTIGSALDVHVYDIARVEALAGPQGTLFGASSEAGTLRIITNPPKQGVYEGGVDLTLDGVAHGDFGHTEEGFLNVPITDSIAVRLVGFYERDGGYIDNIKDPKTLVFPTSGVVRDNSKLRGDDQNSIDRYGGRAALGIDLDDDWTVTPSVIAQHEASHGTFAYRPSLGDLNNARYEPDSNLDYWYQAALVVQGKIGKFDITYAAAHFERTARYTADYSDYAFFYDRYYASAPEYFGAQFVNNMGHLINPSQVTTQNEDFTKDSHELRIASPESDRLRGVAGLFYQRQTNDWTNLYIVPGLATSQSVTGLPGVNYVNIQYRVDRDYAAFAQASYDIMPQLTLTAGLRGYYYDNTVIGFFGYNAKRSPVGEAGCLPGTVGIYGTQRPCDNIDAAATGSGVSHKLTLTWKPVEAKMLYATWSTGFRPGGINRRPVAPPYRAEDLDNYEVGWKTSWDQGRLRFNGALFLEKLNDAQFAVTSDQNGIADIVNAGKAESKGIESDVTFFPMPSLSLQLSGTYVDATTSTDLCQYTNPSNDCALPSPAGNANSVTAPAGSRFPNAPRIKLTGTARYEFPLGDYDAHIQASVFYQSAVAPSLTAIEVQDLGYQPGYASADLAVGVTRGGWSAELSAQNVSDTRGQQLKTSSCNIELCGKSSILIYPILPRLISLRVGWHF